MNLYFKIQQQMYEEIKEVEKMFKNKKQCGCDGNCENCKCKIDEYEAEKIS